MLREITPELPIPFGLDEYISLLPREQRTIQDYGINIGYRRYSSARLRDIAAATPGLARRKWNIRRDPLNVYTVWLEYGEEFVPLTWRSGDAQMPFRDEVLRSLRATDGTPRVDTSRESAALKEGLRRGRYGDPAAARSDARARAALEDPMALTRHLEAMPAPPAEEDEVAPDPRFRRTGGNGFLDGAGDAVAAGDPGDEALWVESGGFTGQSDPVRERLDD
ncbi:Mu transposase C-terminal domain-containing protein [Microbacterium sp. B2969]|uniref:Mu transposase C-terminal domain-containing protein n=1 Tax=Microbacterium alkaliflavum TaxID=3248839 RepID=A0ABW7QEH0_9MICO